jgi:hypothetical protein
MAAWLSAIGKALPALAGSMPGGGGGNVEVSTNQQVTQSANTNINPIVNVQTGRPAAHVDAPTSLSPNTNQSPTAFRPQDANRSKLPAVVGIPGQAGSEYGPFSAAGDTKQPDAGANAFLSSMVSPTAIMLLIGGLVLWMVIK